MTEETADAKDKPVRERKRVRAGHVVFLVIAVAATLALAWWQWTRFRSGTGTFQNLGYALQWPLFGGFFIFAYRKYLEYENEMIDAQNASDDPDFLYERDLKQFSNSPTEIDEDFLPARPQIDVSTFNDLNTPRRGHNDTAGVEHKGEQ